MTNKDPLHGITLQKILEEMVEFFEGWETMGKEIPINCFTKDPSIKS
ncbi:MAG: VF530 family DNA-binding protein, partial [Flavobacterium sp.]